MKALFLLFLTFLAAAQQPTSSDHRVTVMVRNAPADKGSVRVTLYGSEADFLKKPLQSLVAKSKNGGAVAVFDALAAGEYAVAAYQDVNGNGKLDRNFIGIPKEPTGTSNAAKGKFGPPKWRDAVFHVDRDVEKEIVLE